MCTRRTVLVETNLEFRLFYGCLSSWNENNILKLISIDNDNTEKPTFSGGWRIFALDGGQHPWERPDIWRQSLRLSSALPALWDWLPQIRIYSLQAGAQDRLLQGATASGTESSSLNPNWEKKNLLICKNLSRNTKLNSSFTVVLPR